jgi:hypothetical protein
MNYPIWEQLSLTGGTLVAFISVLHAFIAHLAVGGGLFIWLTDLKGFRENSADVHGYIKKYTGFFLLLTMVFGGVSGVGIWFIILLVNPAATSSLIHNFVFGWAIEWVFFLGEIVALLIYHHKFDLLKRKDRLNIAFLYFLFAWLSMVVINGILSFMLTPGTWNSTFSFWGGFFNPTHFPSLFFRTCAAIMIAGLFGIGTSVFIKESAFRRKMILYCSKWLLLPAVGIFCFGLWYYNSIPSSIRTTAFQLNAQTSLPLGVFLITSLLLFLGGLFFLIRTSQSIQKIIIVVLIFIGLGWYGGFEYMREYARKPYIIYNYMYSTSILQKDLDILNREGILKHAKWSPIKEVTGDNISEAGKEIFLLECSACHTIGGFKNNIVKKTGSLSYMGMMSQLTGQGKTLNYMPGFVGTEKEKEAVAAYLTGTLNGMEITREPSSYKPVPLTNTIPPFDVEADEYTLLTWNDLGMHCISDGDKWFVLLPPANTLEAQLIKRGPTPEIITENVELSYKVEDGFANPAKHIDFWKYAEYYFGNKLKKNIGLSGNGLQGQFHFDSKRNGFIAEMIPVAPYNDNGDYNPYPQFYIEAKDKITGKVLASTKAVAPVSTEMGCKNCHGGGWRVNNGAGIADETAVNILKTHDRLNKTDLYASAAGGKPLLCQSCHSDPALGATGKPGINNLSASMHGWHANYMHVEGGKACAMCHPASANGSTRCSRGVHASLGMNCTDCHGTLSDHAASLLKNQLQNRSAEKLLKNLKTVSVASISDVAARTPWIQEPDCKSCHVDFRKPLQKASFNKWNDAFSQLYRMRTDEMGLRCIGCHNSTHSEYPSSNIYNVNRDNTQPMQYSGKPLPIGSEASCKVCHKQDMKLSEHHPNMVRSFRNQSLLTQNR